MKYTEANHGRGVHVGIGASVGGLIPLSVNGEDVLFVGNGIGNAGTAHIPIDIAGVVRLEPRVGFTHSSSSDTSETTERTTSASTVQVTLGAFYMFQLGTSAGGYVGAHLGPSYLSASSENAAIDGTGSTKSTTTRFDFNIAPALGGEYYFSKHFSIGAEVGVNFLIIGDQDTETVMVPAPNPPFPEGNSDDESAFAVHMNTLLVARLFFM